MAHVRAPQRFDNEYITFLVSKRNINRPEACHPFLNCCWCTLCVSVDWRCYVLSVLCVYLFRTSSVVGKFSFSKCVYIRSNRKTVSAALYSRLCGAYIEVVALLCVFLLFCCLFGEYEIRSFCYKQNNANQKKRADLFGD